MKKLLTILALLPAFYASAQTWQSVGSSLGTNDVIDQDLCIDQSTGDLFVAYIESATQKTTVKRWMNDTWTLSGNADFGTGDSQSYVKMASFNGQPYVAVKYLIGTTDYIRVYKLDAGSWVAMGDQAYITVPGGNFSLDTGIDGKVYLLFYKGAGSGFGIPYSLNVIEVTATSQTQVGVSVSYSPAYAYDLTVDPNGTLRVNHETNDGFQYNIYMAEYYGSWIDMTQLSTNGWYSSKIISNAPVTLNNRLAYLNFENLFINRSVNGSVQSTYQVASGVTDFDMASDASSDYFFSTTTTGGNSIHKLDAMDNLTTLETNMGGTGTSKPKIESWNGRVVISYIQSGILFVKELDNEASVTVGSTFTACEEVTTSAPVALVHVTDNNYSHQTLSLSITSNTTAVVPNANITMTGTFPDYSFEMTSAQIFSNQFVEFEIELTENGISSDLQLYTILIGDNPETTILLTQDEYCQNNGMINLSAFGSPAGGIWTGDGVIPGSKFDPNVAGPGVQTLTYAYTNSYGCMGTDEISVTVFDIPTIDFDITTSACGDNDGEIDAIVTGGTPGYIYSWSNGQIIEDIYGLVSGVYTLTVTDQNGCQAIKSGSTVSAGFELVASVEPVSCFGGNNGAIDLSLGEDDLLLIDNLQWSNGETTADIDSLPVGTYEIVVTGTDGCLSIESFVVPGAPELHITTYVNDALCGSADGATSCVVSGGTPGYNYAWTDLTSGLPVGTNATFVNGLTHGSYAVTVTDNNGCSLTGYSLISEDNGPEVIVSNIVNSGCASSGSVDISIVSDEAISGVLWSNGESTEDISALSPGYYTVMVTDMSGCAGWGGAEVEPGLPAAIPVCLVTVDSLTNTNLVVWEKPISTDIASFNIYRETATSGEFLLVGNVPYTDESVYNDLVASPNIRSWRYKISVVNNCGIESELSDFHKTIHLVISTGLGGSVNLIWDDYEGFGFPSYDIYRHTNMDGWQLIQSMPVTLFSYSDTPPTIDGLQYMVSVTPPATCTSSLNKVQDHNSSRSNKSAGISFGGGTNSMFENEMTDFVVYPNPGTGEFYVSVNDLSEESFRITVYDSHGSEVLTEQVSQSLFMLDLSDYADGIYTVKLLAGDQTIFHRITKN